MGMTKTLKSAFWKFLILLLSGLLGAVLIPFLMLLMGAASGIVTYADFSEQSVRYIAPVVASAPDLSQVQLPAGCKYLLLSKNYQVMDATLEGKDLESAMEYAATGKKTGNSNKQYLLVTREEEYVVLQYYIGSQFTDDWINAHFPSPEVMTGILIVLNCVFVCVFLTGKFAQKLRSQLSPLFEATSQIAEQNLDFEVGHSEIREFEDVLTSFSHMKEKLKISLQQQWKAEKLQREQIAALAHDLKTPLTVIQGNIDLLTETTLDEEQQLYSGYILESSQQMESYIRTLIEISRASAGYPLHKKAFDADSFLEELIHQAEALSSAKEKHLETEVGSLPKKITADQTLLHRAVMNIVNNALDYAAKEVRIQCKEVSGNFQITVTDDGKGFSQAGLSQAAQQFYMEDQSRTGNMHFGMGLYIASCIAQQHGGELILRNSPETGGGEVTLTLPCNEKQCCS